MKTYQGLADFFAHLLWSRHWTKKECFLITYIIPINIPYIKDWGAGVQVWSTKVDQDGRGDVESCCV